LTNYEIRFIQETDIQSVLNIYRPYVLNTYITFEYDVPTFEEFSKKIRTITLEYPWLVCLQDNQIIGYAYASEHRHRTAYKWSPESTIYLTENMQGKGIGRILYSTLFDILRLQGFFNVYAGVGMPNEKSERLHKAVGFQELGIFKKVGYKLGKWHDTKWFQLHLQEHIIDPCLPRSINEIKLSSEFHTILTIANEIINK
jgi:L-amino acid N-acyltransferase YncA